MTRVQKKLLVYGEVVIVGIDVAKRKHYARIYDQKELDIVKPFQIHNTREGFYRLVSKIKEAEGKAKTAVIGMEPTGYYWKRLAWFLQEQGYTVVIVNPYHVKRRKEEDNTPRKTDRKDACIIAKLVKDGKYLSCLLPKGIYADLRNLTATRRQLKQKQTSTLQASIKKYNNKQKTKGERLLMKKVRKHSLVKVKFFILGNKRSISS
jgi:transposase